MILVKMDITPCRVVIEPCNLMANLVNQPMKRKLTAITAELSCLHATANEDQCQSHNKTKKVLLKRFGDKVIAVICKNKRSSNDKSSNTYIYGTSQNGYNILQGFEQTFVKTEEISPNENINSELPFSQPYITDVTLSSVEPFIPLIRPSQSSKEMPTTASPFDSNQFNISNSLFHDMAEFQTPEPNNISSNLITTTPTCSEVVASSNLLNENQALETLTSSIKVLSSAATHQSKSAIYTDINDTITNAPMTTSITSMFAKSSERRICENNTIPAQQHLQEAEVNQSEALVRVAESLLLLSEMDSSCKFCVSCRKVVSGVCTIHGDPMTKLEQTRALLSTPSTMCVQESYIEGAGLGVFALGVFEFGSLFGPMEGEILSYDEHLKRENNAYVWEIYEEDRTSISHFLDCMNPEKSNWMRFVNCARFEEEQNLIAEQYDKSVFYKAYKRILPGQELLVWYGNAYGRELRDQFSHCVPVSPIEGDEDYGIEEEIAIPVDEQHLAVKTVEDVVLEDAKFECKHCSALFTTEHHLNRHSTYVCSETAEFRCDICSIQFKSRSTYKRHKERGHDFAKKFTCILCSAMFTVKGNLKVHLKTHLDIKGFTCEHCSKEFSRSTFLRSHVMAVHEKEKPFICKVCDKRFSRADSLKRHSTIHDEERREVCVLCGVKFRNLDSLNAHVRKSHPLGKDMVEEKCDICELVYPDLNVHKKLVHKAGIQKPCPVCKRLFSNLPTHMLVHNREEATQCPICGKYFVALNGHMKVHLQHTKLFKAGKITMDDIEFREAHKAYKAKEEKRTTNDDSTPKKKNVKNDGSASKKKKAKKDDSTRRKKKAKKDGPTPKKKKAKKMVLHQKRKK